MKKIINGKKYDTETAEELGSYSNEYGVDDFKYCEETLYRKRTTGEYFLYGKGGALSKYFKFILNSRTGSEKITPYTETQAKQWAEIHLDVDEYEKLFGEVAE